MPTPIYNTIWPIDCSSILPLLYLIYNTLDEAIAASNVRTQETGCYWTAIHDDRVNGWIITDRYYPAA